MVIDHDRKFLPECVPALVEWSRQVSGIPAFDIVMGIWTGSNDKNVAAWVDGTGDGKTYIPVVHINTICLSRFRDDPILYFKVYVMHEAGHVLMPRPNPHGNGTAEFYAQLWAIQRASRTGMERELRMLKYQARRWGTHLRWVNPLHRRYIIGHRLLARKGII